MKKGQIRIQSEHSDWILFKIKLFLQIEQSYNYKVLLTKRNKLIRCISLDDFRGSVPDNPLFLDGRIRFFPGGSDPVQLLPDPQPCFIDRGLNYRNFQFDTSSDCAQLSCKGCLHHKPIHPVVAMPIITLYNMQYVCLKIGYNISFEGGGRREILSIFLKNYFHSQN